jgi:methylmalonyl-CoA mutase
MDAIHKMNCKTPVRRITGTGGSGKSSLVDELVRRFLVDFPENHWFLRGSIKRKTGGALFGRQNSYECHQQPRVYMRSLATRQSNLALSKYVADAIQVIKAAKYDIILETSGNWPV